MLQQRCTSFVLVVFETSFVAVVRVSITILFVVVRKTRLINSHTFLVVGFFFGICCKVISEKNCIISGVCYAKVKKKLNKRSLA